MILATIHLHYDGQCRGVNSHNPAGKFSTVKEHRGLPCSSDSEEPPANARGRGSVPEMGRSHGEGND